MQPKPLALQSSLAQSSLAPSPLAQRRAVLAFGALSTGLAAIGVRAQAPLKIGVIYNTPIDRKSVV